MKPTLNEQLARMQKIAGIIKENQINEAKKINLTPVQKKEFFDAIEDLSLQEDFEYALGEAGNVLANIITNGEAEYIEDVEDFGYDAEEVEQYAMDLAGESELDENKKSYYKDAEKDDAAHIDALEKDMKDDAKKTSEGKMTKSDLKSKIKEMILAELNEDSTEDVEEPGALNNMYSPLGEAEGDKEINKKLADLARKGMEDSYNKDDEEELEDHNYDAEFLFKYFKNKSDLFMDEMREYDAEELMNSYPGLSQEEAEKLEDMLQNPLDEAKKDEEVEDVTVDDTEVVDAPASDMMAGESTEVSGIQSNLQAAYAEAKALGDEKLITQIANTITYFTKAHILDTAPVNEAITNDNAIYDILSNMDNEDIINDMFTAIQQNPSMKLEDFLNQYDGGNDLGDDNDDNYDDSMDVYDDSYPDMAEAKKAKNKLDQINENMFPMLKRILR